MDKGKSLTPSSVEKDECLTSRDIITEAESPDEENDNIRCKLQINRQTLPLKLVLFLYSGAMAAILPYLTIHMREIGITIQETAIIYAVLPFTSFLGPPLVGFLADKFGQYKAVLIFSTLANGIFHTLLLTVPIYSLTIVREQVAIQLTPGYPLLVTLTNRPEICSNLSTFFTKEHNSISGGVDEVLTVKILNCNIQNHPCSLIVNDTEAFSSIEDLPNLKCTLTSFQDKDSSSILIDEDQLRDLKINFWDWTQSRTNQEVCGFHGNLQGYVLDKSDQSSSIECDINLIRSREIGNNSITFWTYFLIRIFATMFMGSCFALLDATTLAIVTMHNEAEYGKERIFSVLGFGLISPIAGVLVDQISKNKGYMDYSAAFYLSNALLICNVLIYFLMTLHVEKPEKGFAKNARNLLRYPEVVFFLIMIFILGTFNGFVESYLFIFLVELEAPNYLLGLTLTVGSIAGIPFSYGSEKILNYFGRVNILVLAFVAYFVRFFGYSYINSPFWCFPYEAMEAFTYHLMWISAATYCAKIAPKGLLATLTGVMGSLHYSLGKGNGAFIGGYLIGAIGTRLSFRYFGLASVIVGIVYFIANFFWLDKANENRKQENQKDDENVPSISRVQE